MTTPDQFPFTRARQTLAALAAALLLFTGARLTAAETVHLFLKANGADIKGDCMQKTLNREGSIECLSFENSVTALTASSGQVTGRRQYNPIKILKRVDKSTPLLEKALVQNVPIEATFRFYRPVPKGADEEYFAVQIAKGHVASIRIISPDATDKNFASKPVMEEVTFTFSAITLTYEPDGVEFSDSWATP